MAPWRCCRRTTSLARRTLGTRRCVRGQMQTSRQLVCLALFALSRGLHASMRLPLSEPRAWVASCRPARSNATKSACLNRSNCPRAVSHPPSRQRCATASLRWALAPGGRTRRRRPAATTTAAGCAAPPAPAPRLPPFRPCVPTGRLRHPRDCPVLLITWCVCCFSVPAGPRARLPRPRP